MLAAAAQFSSYTHVEIAIGEVLKLFIEPRTLHIPQSLHNPLTIPSQSPHNPLTLPEPHPDQCFCHVCILLTGPRCARDDGQCGAHLQRRARSGKPLYLNSLALRTSPYNLAFSSTLGTHRLIPYCTKRISLLKRAGLTTLLCYHVTQELCERTGRNPQVRVAIL